MKPRASRILLVLLLASVSPAFADPVAGKLDARARASLARLRAGGQSVFEMRKLGASIGRDGALDVFIRGTVTRARLEAAGARVRTALPGLFTASIPAHAVERVEALEDVAAIAGGAPCAPELDASVPTTGAGLLRGAGPEFAGLNGQGVLIGLVDTGIDFDHADFKDSTGATRIVSLWDQTELGPGPPGYPYGKEWTSAQIDGGGCTATDPGQHGTHVAGIAAGDGSQTGGGSPAFTYAGMAPRADLVVVKTDFLTPEIVDAVGYVFDKAAARGQSAVVNLSLGTHYGPHDGASPFEQAITALSGPGRIVVKSAGNDRGAPVHAQTFATPGGSVVTLSVSGSQVDRYFTVDGYYNATERLRVQVRTPNGLVIGPVALNTSNGPWPGQSTQNGVVYLSHDSLSAAHRNIYLEVYVENANKPMNGTWTLTLFADQLGAANGEVDLWRYFVSPGASAGFVTGNLPTQELVTEPGNAHNVITVGAWASKDGWTACHGAGSSYPGAPAVGNLATFSSPGPTRDGRLKPELVAPGAAIASATSFDVTQTCPAPPTFSELLADGMNHRILQGTSMSAPHVTGAVALLLQKYGAITPQTAAAYLASHARADGFTGAVPNVDWGHGKLDLGDLIDPIARVVSPNGGEQTLLGQSLKLTWTASDSLGSVASVNLYLSRGGPGGPFEIIATGLANTGTYDLSVTAPTTLPNAAYLLVFAFDTNGNFGVDLSDSGFTITGPVGVGEPGGAAGFALTRVHPNPTRGDAEIEFTLPRAAAVRLTVRDVGGRVVALLADGSRPAGIHRAQWARGRAGSPPGLYFIRLETPEGRFTRRIVLLR